MTESAATAPQRTVPTPTDGNPTRKVGNRHEQRRRRELPHAELPRQLARDELLTRIAELPTREGMRPPRADLADNLGRFYDALWRHAHGRGTARYRFTGRQMAHASGYDDWDYDARSLTSIRNYIALLEEAGLVTISGRDELADGRTCVVTLHEPPERLESAADGRRSSAGQPTCRALRRRETRPQRQERRVRPWCPKGGRGRAVERWFFFWGPYVAPQGLDSLRESNLPTAVRGCAAGRPPGGGLSDAQPPTRDPAPPAAGEAAPSLGPMGWVDRRSLVGLLGERLAEGGEAGLVELATAPGVDPVELALAGWELLVAPGLRARGGDGSPRLKRSRRRQLANACRVIDRVLEQPGAGVVLLLQALDREREQLELFDDRERSDYWPGRGSLGYFIVELRRVKSRWRRHWRDRRQASGGRRARGSGQGGSGA